MLPDLLEETKGTLYTVGTHTHDRQYMPVPSVLTIGTGGML